MCFPQDQHVIAILYDIMTNPNPKSQIKKWMEKKKRGKRNENENKPSPTFIILTTMYCSPV